MKNANPIKSRLILLLLTTTPYTLQSCADKSCTSCPTHPAECLQCKSFHFLSEKKCSQCISGCLSCNNSQECLSCTSTYQMADDKTCKFKSWIWISIAGAVALVVVVIGVLIYFYDKRAVKIEKKLEKEKMKRRYIAKRMEEDRRKAELDKVATECIEDNYKSIGGSKSETVKTPDQKYSSRVKMQGGKLTEYLVKLKLTRQHSLGMQDVYRSSGGRRAVTEDFKFAEDSRGSGETYRDSLGVVKQHKDEESQD